jgi:histidinol phosphatase-like enzyme
MRTVVFISHPCVRIVLQIFAATVPHNSSSSDFYRKPRPGMFWLLSSLCNGAQHIDTGASFLVGDAAGGQQRLPGLVVSVHAMQLLPAL